MVTWLVALGADVNGTTRVRLLTRADPAVLSRGTELPGTCMPKGVS